MKKTTVLVLSIFLFFSHTLYSEDIPLEFPRMALEPADMDPERLLDAEYHYTNEKGVYQRKIIDALVLFESGLSNAINQKNRDLFVGGWYLQDANGERIGKSHRWGGSPAFSFRAGAEGISYSYHSVFAWLYYSDTDQYYFSPDFFYGITKQIKLHGDRLYLYVLIGDTWTLDPIHEGGKYFYVRGEG